MEEQEALQVHQPCDHCGSSDAVAIYEDHTFCFSCSHHEFTKEQEGKKHMTNKMFAVTGKTMGIQSRGLTEETCKKFGYTIGMHNGAPVQIANYKRGGEIIGQKIRTKNKEFLWNGIKRPGLYGQQLWKSNGRKLIITEGEIDAMSVSQIQEHKWPVVSLPHGAAAAKKAIKQELEWIETFEEVILMFDMDEPGEKAAYECCMLMTPGKAKIAQLPLKDANEMLLAHRSQELITAIWNAKDYLPSGIVNANELWDDIQKPIEEGLSYPWNSLTNLTHGIRTGEVVTLGAGTGLGKTTCFKQIAYHLLTVHMQKVGVLFLEESNAMTALSLMSLKARKPLHLPGVKISDKEKHEIYSDLFDSGNLYLFNHFGSTDFDEIKIRMRFLAVSCGVKYIFLDHVTALTSGGKQADERKEIDKIMTELASIVRELDITLFMISHLTTPETSSHEEGARVTIRQFRGSRSIGQWSNYVFALERNQQADDESKRHTSTFRILKDRYTGGSTGSTFQLKFDADTQQLVEVVDNPYKSEPIKESTNDFSDF